MTFQVRCQGGGTATPGLELRPARLLLTGGVVGGVHQDVRVDEEHSPTVQGVVQRVTVGDVDPQTAVPPGEVG